MAAIPKESTRTAATTVSVSPQRRRFVGVLVVCTVATVIITIVVVSIATNMRLIRVEIIAVAIVFVVARSVIGAARVVVGRSGSCSSSRSRLNIGGNRSGEMPRVCRRRYRVQQ